MDKTFIVSLIIQFIVIAVLLVLTVLARKGIVKGEVLEALPSPEQVLSILSSWAYKLVVSAKNQMKTSTGNEKFDHVSKELLKISEQYNIELDQEMIKGLIEEAYDKMIQYVDKEE